MPSARRISLRQTVCVQSGEVREEKGGSKSANEQPLHNKAQMEGVWRDVEMNCFSSSDETGHSDAEKDAG